ncbi:MAG: fused MFS/spermidine synthase, partial [Armatimonadota bacterium]|nr:fused MFS/spermidine synthase [Armatimonadota bacterium]
MTRTSCLRKELIYSLAIWLLAFATGWFVMLTELVAARVLSPYFGNSIYVWGSVIAIFLVTLAIGYAFGGRLTRRSISAFIPITFAALAGLYVAATPLYQDSLSAWLCKIGLELKWGALFASIILYGLPMILLGSVSPYCIQLATKVHTEAGHHAGLLYAISTIGSFGGSLVTAFYLIPLLPLTAITTIAGFTLIAIASIVALTMANRIKIASGLAVILAVVAIILGCRHSGASWHSLKAYQYPLKNCVLSNTPPSKIEEVLEKTQAEARKEAEKFMYMPATTIFERETAYHHIQIYQEGP